MAAQKQIEEIMDTLSTASLKEFFQAMDESRAGIGAVSRFLLESEEVVTAGKIADVMDVSAARVTALLKKMVAKGPSVQEADPSNARVPVVRLPEKGSSRVKAMLAHLHAHIGTVIDIVGMERMQEFIAISRKTQAVMPEPDFAMEVNKQSRQICLLCFGTI